MAVSSGITPTTSIPLRHIHLAFPDNIQGMIAYDTWGEGGRAVICMPAPGDLREEYNYLAPALAGIGYCPMVMDLRGMGQSTRRWPHHQVEAMVGDVSAILKSAERGATILVACSTSAAVAALSALRMPQRITGLVLISPIIYAGKHHRTMWRRFIHHPRLLRTPWGATLWTNAMRKLIPSRPERTESHLRHIATNLHQPGRLRDLAAMLDTEITEVEHRLSDITVPTLIVMGEKDPLFANPRSCGEYIKSRIPDSELMVIPGAGHYPHWEMPTLTSAVITNWMQRTIPPTPVS